jgi:hypothetical protein
LSTAAAVRLDDALVPADLARDELLAVLACTSFEHSREKAPDGRLARRGGPGAR